jgi:hypothetical protein
MATGMSFNDVHARLIEMLLGNVVLPALQGANTFDIGLSECKYLMRISVIPAYDSLIKPCS